MRGYKSRQSGKPIRGASNFPKAQGGINNEIALDEEIFPD
jgi:hypothetical protein